MYNVLYLIPNLQIDSLTLCFMASFLYKIRQIKLKQCVLTWFGLLLWRLFLLYNSGNMRGESGDTCTLFTVPCYINEYNPFEKNTVTGCIQRS